MTTTVSMPDDGPENNETYDSKRMAELLHLTMWGWYKAKQGGAFEGLLMYKKGKRWLVDRADFWVWFRSQQASQTAAPDVSHDPTARYLTFEQVATQLLVDVPMVKLLVARGWLPTPTLINGQPVLAASATQKAILNMRDRRRRRS